MPDLDRKMDIEVLINEYTRIACAVTRVVCKKFDIIHPLQGWRRGYVERVTKLNRRVCLYFHGIGCTVRFRRMHFKNCAYYDIAIDYNEDSVILDEDKISYFIERNFNIYIHPNEIVNRIKLMETYCVAKTISGQQYVCPWRRKVEHNPAG